MKVVKKSASQQLCESCGLYPEDPLMLLVRWAPKAGEFDSRSTHAQLLQDLPDSVEVVDKLDVVEVVIRVVVVK